MANIEVRKDEMEKKGMKEAEIIQLIIGAKLSLSCLRKKHDRNPVKDIWVCFNCTEKTQLAYLLEELIQGNSVKKPDKIPENLQKVIGKNREELLQIREEMRILNRNLVKEAIRNKTNWSDETIDEKLAKAKRRLQKG